MTPEPGGRDPLDAAREMREYLNNPERNLSEGEVLVVREDLEVWATVTENLLAMLESQRATIIELGRRREAEAKGPNLGGYHVNAIQAAIDGQMQAHHVEILRSIVKAAQSEKGAAARGEGV